MKFFKGKVGIGLFGFHSEGRIDEFAIHFFIKKSNWVFGFDSYGDGNIFGLGPLIMICWE